MRPRPGVAAPYSVSPSRWSPNRRAACAACGAPLRGCTSRLKNSGNAALIGDASKYSAAGHFRPRASEVA